MKKDIMNWPTLKEIERDLFKVLQHAFADVLSKVLEDLINKLQPPAIKDGFVSPSVESLAMELAVSGRSYRHASSSLAQFLGYRVISHEAIRQRILEAEVSFKKEMKQECRLLFIEVDGLYIKHQREKKRGREEKIASVHEGWKRIGKRASLVNKRHFVHKGEVPFWDSLEE